MQKQNLLTKLTIITIVIFITAFSAVKAISINPTQEEKSVALTNPSVVRILTTFCGRFILPSKLGTLPKGKTYDFCTASTGSGFVISPDGYIGTNGHVVKYTNNSRIRTAFLSKEVIRFYVDLNAEIESMEKGIVYTQSEKDTLVNSILSNQQYLEKAISQMIDLYDKKLINVAYDPEQVYVQNKEYVFEINQQYKLNNASRHYKAEIIASDYDDPKVTADNQVEFISSDVAILKIDVENYPSVNLGSIENLSIASPIVVIGFPGKANSPITSEQSSAQATITKGVVSAIKDEAGGKRKLIQTDASIAHGNSGGPALDAQGNVVGIATYVTIPDSGSGDESGDFNFLRDVADLKVLAQQNDVELGQSEVDIAWKKGLEFFWDAKYSRAIEEFNTVKTLFPQHLLVNDYLKRAEEGVKNGEENLELIDYVNQYISKDIKEDQLPILGVSIVGICLVSLLVLFVLVTLFKSIFGGKKKAPAPVANPTNYPETSQLSQSFSQNQLNQLAHGNMSQPVDMNGADYQIKPVQPQQSVPVQNFESKPIETYQPKPVNQTPAMQPFTPNVANNAVEKLKESEPKPQADRIVQPQPLKPIEREPLLRQAQDKRSYAPPPPVRQPEPIKLTPKPQPVKVAEPLAREELKTSPVIKPLIRKPLENNTSLQSAQPFQPKAQPIQTAPIQAAPFEPVQPKPAPTPIKPITPQPVKPTIQPDIVKPVQSAPSPIQQPNPINDASQFEAIPNETPAPGKLDDDELPDWLKPIS